MSDSNSYCNVKKGAKTWKVSLGGPPRVIITGLVIAAIVVLAVFVITHFW